MGGQGQAMVRLLAELQGHAPISLFPLYLFSLSFFCCVVLSLCLLPLLLSRLFGHCPNLFDCEISLSLWKDRA